MVHLIFKSQSVLFIIFLSRQLYKSYTPTYCSQWNNLPVVYRYWIISGISWQVRDHQRWKPLFLTQSIQFKTILLWLTKHWHFSLKRVWYFKNCTVIQKDFICRWYDTQPFSSPQSFGREPSCQRFSWHLFCYSFKDWASVTSSTSWKWNTKMWKLPFIVFSQWVHWPTPSI